MIACLCFPIYTDPVLTESYYPAPSPARADGEFIGCGLPGTNLSGARCRRIDTEIRQNFNHYGKVTGENMLKILFKS